MECEDISHTPAKPNPCVCTARVTIEILIAASPWRLGACCYSDVVGVNSARRGSRRARAARSTSTQRSEGGTHWSHVKRISVQECLEK